MSFKENSVRSSWNASANEWKNTMSCSWVFEAFNKQDWNQCRAVKASSVWWSSVHSSNDRKFAGHDKEQCLEDYHWRFGHAESLCKMVSKLLNCHLKEHYMQVCQDIIEHLQTEPGLLRRIIAGDETDFWEGPGNQAREQSIYVSNVTKAEENKKVKVKSQSCWSRSSMWRASSTASSCNRIW